MTDLKPEDRALIELRPCPFCGSPGRLSDEIISPRGKAAGEQPSWDIECTECSVYSRFSSPADAVAWWNTRTEGRESRPSGVAIERAARDLIANIEQDPRGVWFVNASNPEALVTDLFHALSPSVGAETLSWRPDREAVARLIHFMHGDGLSAEDAMRPSNDAHWNFWKDDPPHADAWKAADAILSLVPSQGKAGPSSDVIGLVKAWTTARLAFHQACHAFNYSDGDNPFPPREGPAFDAMIQAKVGEELARNALYRAALAAAPAQPGGGE